MERLKLVKEMIMGPAKVIVTITQFGYKRDGLLGDVEEIITNKEIQFIINGVVKTTIYSKDGISFKDGRATLGNIQIPANRGDEIVDFIELVEKEFEGLKVVENSKEEEEVEVEVEEELIVWARKVIIESKTRVDILSRDDEKTYIRNYNNLHNEGGEGYVPQRITKEDVVEAEKILKNRFI